MGPGPADLNAASTDKDCDPSGAPLVGQWTMGPGPGLAHVLWRYCMRLASSGVGGVRRVRLAFGRHPMHPPHTPDDASRIQNIIHKTQTQLPTYNNDRRTRRTPPTPDDASRMRYRNKTCATSPGPGPTVCVYNILVAPRFKNILRLEAGYPALRCHILEGEPRTSATSNNTAGVWSRRNYYPRPK